MVDRILFWPRSNLIFFCVAKKIQEKYDSEFYLIVNDKHSSKNFYETQKIVKFKKIWHYDDYVNETFENPDIEYLKKFEEKYKINLWSIIYTDRIFLDYNRFHKFSETEILSIVEYGCKFFEKIVNKVKPDFLILDSTAYHEDILLYEICKAKGVKILDVWGTRFGNKMTISHEFEKFDYQEIDEFVEKNGNESFEDLRHYIEPYNQLQKSMFQTTVPKTRLLKSIFKFLISIDNKFYVKHFPHYGKTPFHLFIINFIDSIKRKYRESYIERNSITTMDDKVPFVYFPLHYQPEKSTAVMAPYYVNQLEIIRHIAKSLPIQYSLLVKEHPYMKIHNWRETSFYKELISLPNVKLVNTSISNTELLKSSSLVVTITGTPGLDAAFYGKPTIIFADCEYSDLPSVYKIRKIEELPKAILTSITKKVELSDLKKYVKRVIKNSFDFEWMTIGKEISLISNKQENFQSLTDISEPKFKEFLKKRKDSFERFADEYIKKMYEYKKALVEK